MSIARLVLICNSLEFILGQMLLGEFDDFFFAQIYIA
jgi:hypothetical protein